jgi:hypothetical protein
MAHAEHQEAMARLGQASPGARIDLKVGHHLPSVLHVAADLVAQDPADSSTPYGPDRAAAGKDGPRHAADHRAGGSTDLLAGRVATAAGRACGRKNQNAD